MNPNFKIIYNMKKNNMSEEEISKLINLELSIVQKIANKELVDLPLHLLGTND